MLKTRISIDSSINATNIVVEYNGVDYGATTSMLRISSSIDLSTSVVLIIIEYNSVNDSNKLSGNPNRKFAF